MRTVMKFGGSVLSTPADFRKAAAIVKARRAKGEEIVLVNSALSGVTDALIRAADGALRSEARIPPFLDQIREQHFAALAGVKDPALVEQCRQVLEAKFHRLQRVLHAVNSLNNLAPRSQDLIYTFGERFAARILEAYLLDAGVKARAFDADEAGLVTSSDYGNARPDLKQVRKNFRKLAALSRASVVVITGYFGVDKNYNVVCFGRGGSDYSAGIVANAVDAERLELWKDVGCFYSADPRMVKAAHPLDWLSYHEAEELGYFGAKIIHPKTIPPLREKGIEAVIRSVGQPEKAGTRICAEPPRTGRNVKAIAARKGITLVTVHTGQMVDMPGYLAKLFGAMAEAGISVDFVSTSEAGITYSIETKQLAQARKALAGLAKEGAELHFETGLALLGIIGESIRSTPGVLGKVCSVLGNAHINIEALSQGASEIDLMLVVKESEVGRAVQFLHRKLVEGKP